MKVALRQSVLYGRLGNQPICQRSSFAATSSEPMALVRNCLTPKQRKCGMTLLDRSRAQECRWVTVNKLFSCLLMLIIQQEWLDSHLQRQDDVGPARNLT